MPDEGIFCGSEERKPSHTLLYGTNVSWRSIGELAGRAQQRACFLSFVTKLLREKDRVWCAILLWWGIFRGALYIYIRGYILPARDKIPKMMR